MRLMMAIEPKMKLRMSLSMICQVCKLPLEQRDNFEVAVLGVKSKYHLCKCGREVHEVDTNYKRRWRYWNKKTGFCTWD